MISHSTQIYLFAIIPLTTNPDNIVGTAGNDIVNGLVDFAAGAVPGAISTYNTADTINGAGGTNTLNLVLQNAGAAITGFNAPDISNMQVVNIRNVSGQDLFATGAGALDVAALLPGATTVVSDRSTDDVYLQNLAAGAAVGVNGNGSVVNGDLEAGYVAAATAATLNISGGTKGGNVTLLGGGLTSLTVNSKGAANTIGALTGAATTTSTTIDATTNLTTGAVTNAGATLNIKGAGAVNLSTTALGAGVTKVDASANTGGVTVALGTAVTQTVTGGSGNDVITSGAVLTTGSVDAGEGIDTLNLGSNVAHANTAALAAKYTNFETLRVNGTFDASLIAGITAIELSGATNNISKMSATQAGAVTGLADIGASTLALETATGTTDVLNLTLGNGKGAAFDTGALTVNGFETLNIKANAKVGDADQTSVIASFTADKLTSIGLTGTAVTLTNAATTKAVTIDASELTGNGAATPVGLTISGNLVAGSTVTGSGVQDVFNLGTAGSTYNGGAGDDIFNGSVAQINSAGVYNKLNGGDGKDTLNITGGGAVTMVDADFRYISNIETIVQATTGANNLNVTTGGFFNSNFNASGINYTATVGAAATSIDMSQFGGNATISLTSGAVAQATTVMTGDGADTVTINTASTTAGIVTVATGAGNDTIKITDGTAATASNVVVVEAGLGADNTTLSVVRAASALNAVQYKVGVGESTVSAYDTVSGFAAADGTWASDYVDFVGSGTVSANAVAQGVTGYTAGELTYSVASGVLTFAGTKAATLTIDEALAAIQSVVTVDTATVYYVNGGNGYLFNNNDLGDSVVQMTGLTTVTALTATLNTVTANTFAIA